jgi:hypothetical protein
VLRAVACPAGSSLCTAVGSYTNSGGVNVTLAERGSGGSWSIQPTTPPAGATRSELLGVACPTTGQCVAVGDSTGSSGQRATLTAVWNGGGWSQAALQLGSSRSELLGVACPAPNQCLAVGDATGGGGVQAGLAETWNGSTWTVHSPGLPSGARGSALDAVSCPSTGQCTAVGGAGTVTLAQLWNGSAWVTQSMPATGASASVLDGVSCSSTVLCTATGTTANSSGVQAALGERYS